MGREDHEGAAGRDEDADARGGEEDTGARGRDGDPAARGFREDAAGQGRDDDTGARGRNAEADTRGRDSDTDARGRDADTDARGCDSGTDARGHGAASDAQDRDDDTGARDRADATGAPGDVPPSDHSAVPRDGLFEAPPEAEQERMVEAVLFASAEPMSVADLAARLPHGADPAGALTRLAGRYEGRGVRLVQSGGAWAFRTAPDLAHLMTREQVETRKLSRAAIETLAIIAYHQPVTRAEIEEIRGVGVSRGTLDQLIEMDWVRLGRRRMTPGRPVTFTVTEAFLDHFSLGSARDLPGLKELRAAGLLDNRPPPEAAEDDGEGDGAAAQDDMFAGDAAEADDSDTSASGQDPARD